MSYRLRAGERLADEIRRIAIERIDCAVEELAPSDNDWAERVHNARKQIKKLRALVRLVREEIGDETYDEENISFRDAARGLSAARDSTAIVEAIDKLATWGAARIERSELLMARDQMAAIDNETIINGDDHERLFAPVRAMLRDARQRAIHWPIERNDFRALRGGLLRTYRSARDLFRESLEEPAPEVLHEWRKSVKYLWYQVRLLRPLWPDELRAMARELRGLAELLGDYHDLVTLRSLLMVRPELAGGESGLEQCTTMIDDRRAELERAAFAVAGRFFAEKPKAFVRRIASYWKLWKREAKEAHERGDAHQREKVGSGSF